MVHMRISLLLFPLCLYSFLPKFGTLSLVHASLRDYTHTALSCMMKEGSAKVGFVRMREREKEGGEFRF